MSFQLFELPKGMLDSNSYIIASKGQAALIDAGVGAEHVARVLDVENLKLKYIILTHCHSDHICSTDVIRDANPNSKLLVHDADADAISDTIQNLSYFLGQTIEVKKPDERLFGGEKIQLGDINIEIIHTPGHSDGGICIYTSGHIFTGDTLFKGAWGRTDFPDGNEALLLESINGILENFEGCTIIHAGHGDATSVSDEKNSNPYKHFLSNI